jgi:hypothetical protein
MQRALLEKEDRDALIQRAEAAGVSRARILTRPELIDELLVRSARARDTTTLKRARGFFGVARDLLARVVEKGLHLPDAADRIRARTEPPPPARTAAALPTVTLAEIYATQGHRDRAVETLRRVIEREPEHAAARTLLGQLEDASYVSPKPRLPPEDEVAPILGDFEEGTPPPPARAREEGAAAPAPPEAPPPDETVVPLPDEKHAEDECLAIPMDASKLFVTWKVRHEVLAYVREKRQSGQLVVRILLVAPTWDGPHTTHRDHEVSAAAGDVMLHDIPDGVVLRVAIGWRTGGTFLAIAQSPALEASPSGPELIRWTRTGALPVSTQDPDGRQIRRAQSLARERMAPVSLSA